MNPRMTLPYRIMAVLQDASRRGEPMLPEDVAAAVPCTQRAAENHLREMWAFDLVHIVGWDRNWNAWVPLYRWGRGANAPRPKKMSPAEKTRRWRERRTARPNVGPRVANSSTLD